MFQHIRMFLRFRIVPCETKVGVTSCKSFGGAAESWRTARVLCGELLPTRKPSVSAVAAPRQHCLERFSSKYFVILAKPGGGLKSDGRRG